MNEVAGFPKLLRLFLRRDRFVLPLWSVLVALVPVGAFASSIAELYPTEAQRAQYAADIAEDPSLLMMFGQVPDTGIGGLTVWRFGLGFLIVAVASILTVVRHTRAEEEAGRVELVGASAVGRHASLAAAVLLVLGANLVLAAIITLGMTSRGEPAGGSLAFGLAIGLTGMLFAGVAAVAAQLAQTAAAARGLALGTLAVSFVLRGVADAGGAGNAVSWLGWLSPLGWANRVLPYGQERWWLLVVLAAVAAGLVVLTFALASARDMGSGLVSARPGPAQAAPGLATARALAWRLHRGPLIAWTAGFAVAGAVFGAAADGAAEAIAENADLQDVVSRVSGRAAAGDAFLVAVFSLLGLVAAAYAVQAALRLRSEEASLRADPVLATAVDRVEWTASHLLFAVVGPAAALAAAGVAAGLVHGLATGDLGGRFLPVLAAALVQLPAAWVLAAVATALFGLAPRLAVGAWAVLGLCLLLGQVGALLQLDQLLLDVSPFTHVPKLPGGDASVVPVVALVGVAAALTGAGIAAFRTRDVG